MVAAMERQQADGKVSQRQSANTEEFESYCGIGTCRPKGLQRCNNVLSFSVFFGLSLFITQTLNAYIVSQITVIEKQFGLDSVRSGILLSCNDIGFLSTVLLFGHFGRYSRIPTILSSGCFLFGIAGILSSVSYFVDPYYLPKLSAENILNSTGNVRDGFSASLCRHDNATSLSGTCAEESEIYGFGNSKWPLWLLSGSMVLQGVGKSPQTSLSATYIDNSNPVKTKTGMYLAIVRTFQIMGPPLATVMGGVFRSIPIDLQATLLTPTHPHWLGAWWLGFLVFGCLGLVIGIPLLFFPKYMVRPEQTTDERIPLTEKLQDLPRSLFRVLKNPVYSLILVGVLFLVFFFGGSMYFSSKYVEKQFMVPGSKTNIILGIQSIIGATIGTLLGGILTSRLKLNRLGCMKLIIVCLMICIVTVITKLFLGCETPLIIGFHDKPNLEITNDGVTDCDCDTLAYFPVCGDGKNTYFSPCFAGCTNQSNSLYGGCSKVSSGQTVAGMCETDCTYLYYYLAADLVQKLFQMAIVIPTNVIILRTVAEKDKAVAMALLTFLMSLLGFMPAPIVFGYIIDRTCVIWEQTCGVRGACVQYDLRALRHFLYFTEIGGRVASMIFFTAAIFVLKFKGKDLDEVASVHQVSMNQENIKTVENEI